MILTLGFTALTLAFLSALYAAMTALLAASSPKLQRLGCRPVATNTTQRYNGNHYGYSSYFA